MIFYIMMCLPYKNRKMATFENKENETVPSINPIRNSLCW